MKISQAVLLLASSSSAEKVILEKTHQIDILPSEDGVRSGKTLCNQDFCSRYSDHMMWSTSGMGDYLQKDSF